ncbi:MAG: hypothetical protein AAF550_13930, partial [Myxococcota bacterium]
MTRRGRREPSELKSERGTACSCVHSVCLCVRSICIVAAASCLTQNSLAQSREDPNQTETAPASQDAASTSQASPVPPSVGHSEVARPPEGASCNAAILFDVQLSATGRLDSAAVALGEAHSQPCVDAAREAL